MKVLDFLRKKGQPAGDKEEFPPVNTEEKRTVREVPQTILIWTEEQRAALPDRLISKYEELNNQMPPLRFDEVNLIPIEADYLNEGYYVNVFIRNGNEGEFSLEEISLQLIDSVGHVAAEGIFRIYNFGVLRMGETRFWSFVFDKEHIRKQNPDFSGFTIAIAKVREKVSLTLDLPEEWKGQINEEQEQRLREIIKQLPEIQTGTMNFTGIEATFDSEKNLRVMLMIQNATDKDVTFHKMPLFVRDNQEDIVVEGLFEMGEFQVKAHTIKPWVFIFNKELVKKQEPDMSRWVVFSK